MSNPSPAWISIFAWPCATHLPGRVSGHRVLPSGPSDKALSHGSARRDFPQHAGPCQRAPRLAYLGGFRPSTDPRSKVSLQHQKLWGGVGGNGLRLRFHHHQSLPVALSLGTVRKERRCGQSAYVNRPAGEYPLLGARHAGRDPRRECTGSAAHRNRLVLHPRQGLSRLCPSARHQHTDRFLHHQSQEQNRCRRLYSRPMDRNTGLRCD
jgi:hypothetical protein